MKINYFFPEQASTLATQIDAIYFALILISTVFIIGIAGSIFYLAARYRRTADDQYGAEVHESHFLEIAWSIIPTFIGLGLFFWGAKVFIKTREVPANAMEISVVGKQWMWKFQHPNGRREINQLHVPVGQPVHLRMISQDVIHSVYVPAFRVKQDAVPMFYTSIWFEPTKVGTYHLHCAEYCGKDHSVMGGQVIAMEPSAYQKWLQSDWSSSLDEAPQMASAVSTMPSGTEAGTPAKGGLVAEGAKLFTSMTCITCHASKTPIGPSLAGVYGSRVTLADGSTVVADDNYIRESILSPQAKIVAGYGPLMPSFQGRVSEEDILKIIAYIKSLRGSK